MLKNLRKGNDNDALGAPDSIPDFIHYFFNKKFLIHYELVKDIFELVLSFKVFSALFKK
jgi:hypothetical protein